MKNIVVLVCLLLLPAGIALLLNHLSRKEVVSLGRASRLGLALVMFVTGLTHFVQTDGMATLIPPSIPGGRQLIIITGVLEIAAGIGLLIESIARWTAGCLIVFFIAVFPANVWAALNYVEYGGHSIGPAYLLVRGPLQALLIIWSWRVLRKAPFESSKLCHT